MSNDIKPEIILNINIESTIESFKISLQEETKKDLSNYEVWLQNVQMLEPFKTLVDQCVGGAGLVQVNVQILDDPQRINIADVVKPTDEVDDAKSSEVLDINIGINTNESNNGQLWSVTCLCFFLLIFFSWF